LSATVTSDFDVQTVHAQAAGRGADLSYSVGKGWSGAIDFTGVPYGPGMVTVTAVDVLSNMASTTLAYMVDRPPVVTVIAPDYGGWVGSDIRVAATCTDDGPGGCTSLTVDAVQGTPLASGTSSFDTTISLAQYGGAPINLYFRGTDSAGQVTPIGRFLFYDASPAFKLVAHVLGTVRDFDSTRVLFTSDPADARSAPPYASTGTLSIRDLGALSDTLIYSGLLRGDYGLVPSGAVFTANPSVNVLHWHGGTTTDLGVLGRFPLAVNGRYLSWCTPSCADPSTCGFGLRFADSQTDQTTDIANSLVMRTGVGPNGDVVFSTNDYRVHRYRNAAETIIDDSQMGLRSIPVTDGINVLYSVENLGSGTTIVTPTGVVPLSSAISLIYLVDSGWAAYDLPGGTGARQVWVRSPGGQQSQVSIWTTDSKLEALSSSGDVIFSHQGRRYLGRASQLPVDVSSDLGKAYWKDGAWYVVVGGSVISLDISGDGGATMPDASSPAPDGATDGGASPSDGSSSDGSSASTDSPAGVSDASLDRSTSDIGSVPGLDAGANGTDSAADASISESGSTADASSSPPDAPSDHVVMDASTDAHATTMPGASDATRPVTNGDLQPDSSSGCSINRHRPTAPNSVWILCLVGLLLRRRQSQKRRLS
jgi:hypothetical protein